MNATIKLIQKKAIELGFQFNESDAHDMYLILKNDTIEKEKDIIIADTKEFLSTIGMTSWPKLTELEQHNITSINENIERLLNQ